ncbi:MAG TPA: response regulator transcription factor [Candidatus Saccharimonadales bacterium]
MNIAVVEDEASIREFEVTYLAHAGYGVADFSSAHEALKHFRDEQADLWVIDLNLPGMDGLELCRVIRSTSPVPILIVTARNSDEDEVKGLELGADDYLKKPFNPNVLVARVHALLRRKATKQLVFGELRIDPATMAVTRGKQPITLTTTRFNLLLTLASQPNVVLTRAQLVDQIYSDPSAHDVYDRTIDAHIKALRQQIEPDPHHPKYIETVIGAGYRFRTPS